MNLIRSFIPTVVLPRLFLACLAACVSTQLCAIETRDLLVVAGQSNAVGFDAAATECSQDARDKEVLFWWRCGDPPPDDHDSNGGGSWTYLQPQPRGNPLSRSSGEVGEARFGLKRQYGNFSQAAGGFGPEIGLARNLLNREVKPLAVLKVAFSGTSLSADWNRKETGEGGACYRALIQEWNSANADAKQRGVVLRPRAFVWVQGESDANAKDVESYEARLEDMLSALRTEFGAPNLPALVGVNVHFGNDKNPFVARIVEAQKQVAAKDPRHCRYVDTDGAETLLPSQTHFTAKGTLEIGKRYADALLQIEEASAAAR